MLINKTCNKCGGQVILAIRDQESVHICIKCHGITILVPAKKQLVK